MFKNLTIRTRLIFTLSFLVVFLLGVEMLGLFGMSQSNAGLKNIYEDRVIPLAQLGQISSLLQQNRFVVTAAFITPTPEVIDNNSAIFEKNVKEISIIWDKFITIYLTPAGDMLADKFDEDRTKLINEGLLPTLAALRAGELKKANQIVLAKVDPLYELVMEDISTLTTLQIELTKQKYESQQIHFTIIRNIFIALIIFILALAVLISVAFTRAVFKPLEQAFEVARGVAAGNFSQHIEVRSADEIGQLMQALKDMNIHIINTVGKLKDREAYIRSLMNSLIEGVISTNEYGVIETFNPAAEDIFGYTENEAIGQNVSFLTPNIYPNNNENFLKRHLGTGVAKTHLGVIEEVKGLHKNGTIFPMEIAVGEMRWKDHIVFTCIVNDISERKLEEEHKMRLIHELESTHEELKNFAYVVSHDLKAPLRAISALASWLSHDYSDKFDEEGKKHMHLLIQRVYRMDNLINGILQYSRVGQVKERLVAVNLDQLVREVIDSISPPSHIEVVIENILPTIMIEPTRIEQVFQNLLSNAIKYMDKSQGEIHIACNSGVGCNSEDKLWEFSITDNGPGIETRHFERIFQLFQTLTPRDKVEGTGVGLSLVKKIVEMYGGKVWLKSEIGEGSTFFFTLPKTYNKVV